MDQNEILFCRFIGNLFKIEVNDNVTETLKNECVSYLFQAWEIEKYKLHVINLVNYLNSQSALNGLSKLKIIKLDLQNLLS